MTPGSHRPRGLAATPLLALVLCGIGACASGPVKTECPDGTFVIGTKCELTADGTYVGNSATVPRDVSDDTADVADEQVNQESGMEEVDVEVIEIDKN